MSILITSRAINNSLSELRLVLRIPLLTTLLIMALQSIAFSQNVSINATGASPDNSAMLDVNSTSKGFLMPRMTTAQKLAISSPANGLMIFQTDANPGLYCFDSASTNWIQILDSAGVSALINSATEDSTRLTDADGDTKIQVEESADEDIIRFDMAGTEFFRMDSGRIEVINPNNSIAIGNNSGGQLISNASSFQNVVIGNNAMQGVIGRDNVGVGFAALNSVNSIAARENTAIGMSSMQDLTSGHHNTAIGRASLTSMQSGFENTAIGRNTLFGNTGGTQNVALGNQAGFNATGSLNIFIGHQAGTSQTGSNLLFIENSSSSAPLVYGDFAADSLVFNGNVNITGNVGIGTTTPKAQFQVDSFLIFSSKPYDGVRYMGFNAYDDGAGDLRYINDGPVSLYAFSDDNTGLFLWPQGTADSSFSSIDPSASLRLEDSTITIDGSASDILLRVKGNGMFDSLSIDNAYGFPASDGTNGQVLQTDGSGNVTWETPTSMSLGDTTQIADADGDTKIQLEESADEDIIRFDMAGTEFFRMNSGRLEIVNTGKSVFLGDSAGFNDDLSNNENVFIGDKAGLLNTSGAGNTVLGSSAYNNANTASGNAVVGWFAGTGLTTGSNNTLIGAFAAPSLSTGEFNVALGNSALINNQFGDNNLALGYSAGQLNSGSGNIFLGNEAGANWAGSNALFINNTNSATPLIYGDFANDSVKIYGNLSIGNEFSFPSADGTNGQVMQTDGAGNVSWQTFASVSGSGSASKLARWSNASTLDSSLIQDDGVSVSINASPSAYQQFLVSNNGSTFTTAISGEQTLNSATTTIGVYGSSASTDVNNAAGVYGYASNGAFAVYGQNGSSAANTVAVNGWNPSGGANQNFGVKGQTSSSNASSAGLYGFAFHGGNAILAQSNARVIEAQAYGVRTASYNAMELNNSATSSTASINKTGLNIQSTGSWTGASAENVGLNVNVAGATTNYAALFNGGNVGIGTSSPTAQLEIVSGATDEIFLSGFSGGAEIKAENQLLLGTSTASVFHLQTNNSSRLSITGTGNVGIGNTSPSFPLSINGATPGDANSAHIQIVENTGSSSMHIGRALAYGFVQTQNAHPLALNPIGNNVGIGTTSPSNALSVQVSATTNAATSSIKFGDASGSAYLGAGATNITTFDNTGNNRFTILQSNGYVGIGASNPLSNLHINSSTTSSTIRLTNSASASNGLWLQSDNLQAYFINYENTPMKFATNGGDRMIITAAGDVGIGTTAPSAKLSVNGAANNTTGSWAIFSDERVKTVNGQFTDGLDVVMKINPVVFNYNENAPFQSDEEQIGIIAQELEKIAPYMVSQSEYETIQDLREVNGQAYVFLLINAIKEQQDIIDTLRENETSNREEIGELKAMLENYLQSEGINPEEFKKQMDTVAKK